MTRRPSKFGGRQILIATCELNCNVNDVHQQQLYPAYPRDFSILALVVLFHAEHSNLGKQFSFLSALISSQE